MINIEDLTVETTESEGIWTACTNAYPDITGTGDTEDDAKADLELAINAAGEGSEAAE